MAETKKRAKKRVRVWKTETSTSHNLSVRIPLDLYERLGAYCKEQGRTATAVICSALRDRLDEEDAQQEKLRRIQEGGYGFFL